MRALLKSSPFLVALIQAFRLVPSDLQRLGWWLRRPRQITSYLDRAESRKLQIGCGYNRLEGWLNTDYTPRSQDVLFLDATRPFPFSSGTFDYVFSEHVIEHLAYQNGQVLLREAFRVMKPGGILRVATPNLLNIATLLDEPLDDLRRCYIRRVVERYMKDIGIEEPGFVFNNFIWDFGHIFVYDPKTLAIAMTAAGFADPQVKEISKSSHPELSGIESHGKVIGEDLNAFETMVMEARKP
jgi:SAM-dependent methyltransferase